MKYDPIVEAFVYHVPNTIECIEPEQRHVLGVLRWTNDMESSPWWALEDLRFYS
jgi:hypothetical protein